jgi:hypothetical protein
MMLVLSRRAPTNGDSILPSSPPASPSNPPRLLDQLRQTARQRGHQEQTVAALVNWCLRFILFHK